MVEKQLIGQATLRPVKQGLKTALLTVPAIYIENTGIEPGAVFNVFLVEDSCNLHFETGVKPKENIYEIRRIEKQLKNLYDQQSKAPTEREKRYFQQKIDEIQQELRDLKKENNFQNL
jgi:hypothetical protein